MSKSRVIQGDVGIAERRSLAGDQSIAEVARRAGTSIATVSRVFNGRQHVSKKTSARVMGVIEQLNYRPSNYGRSLRAGRRWTIGLLLCPSNADDRLYAEVISNNLTRYISAEQYGVTLEFLAVADDGRLVTPDTVAGKAVDGLVIVGHADPDRLEQMASWGLPICLINNTFDHPNFYSVSLDDYSGSREAVQYLAAVGRKRIALVHGNIEWPSTRARYNGYFDGMKELGLEICREHVICVAEHQQNYQGGYLATLELLRNDPNPSAIYFINDWYAVGGLAAARELGRRVPEDLSIVGYDNSWMATQVLPTLTTVSLEPEEISRRAAGILVRAIEGRPQIVANAQVRPKLIVRESAAVTTAR